MIAENLSLSELVNFTNEGISLQGRRLVIHDMHAIAELRKDLFKILGTENTRRVLTRFGYWWGKADAAAMKRIFKWKDKKELLKSGPRLQTIFGVSKTKVKELIIGNTPDSFRMEIVWENSVEAQEQIIANGHTNTPSCWILTGYASGFVSFCMNDNIFFIEKTCNASKGPFCSAIGRTASAWGEKLNPHLRFFTIEDIQSKVEKLTDSLKKQSRDNDRHRHKIQNKLCKGTLFHTEIKSRSFLRVLDIAKRVAPYDSSLLITGETGTGKEVLANYIYSFSSRAGKIFLAINCGALPETLLESELFGHTEGAFTGANHERAGIFEEANGGTVFLDEIGDMSPALQLKLLRVLQHYQIVRLGENHPRPIDVRIMAATNKDLSSLIKEGTFREDLYYRLAVVEIQMPPLRKRPEDIIPLARHFVSKLSRKLHKPNLRLDISCLDCLLYYNWPGNIRELENAMERAALFCSGDCIYPDDLPSTLLLSNKQPKPSQNTRNTTLLSELEMQHIKKILRITGNNRRKASELLGISQATLWRKLKGNQ